MGLTDQKKLSQELTAYFMKKDVPVPFGLLQNKEVDALPYSYKKVMADAFYRACKYKELKRGKGDLIFSYRESGPLCVPLFDSKLKKIMQTFLDMGFIFPVENDHSRFRINVIKFISQRNI